MTLTLQYDLSGAVEKLRKVEKAPLFDQGIRMLADKAMRSIRALTPGDGTMRDKWRQVEKMNGSGHIESIVIENTFQPAEVVGYMEFGTKPHVIEPKPENPIDRMVFFWPAIDAVVFARHVDHPGTNPYMMIENTITMLDIEMQLFERIFEAKITAFAEAL